MDDFDNIGDMRRTIERLHAQIDRQAERDASLTADRAALAAYIRHGDGDKQQIDRIVRAAMGG